MQVKRVAVYSTPSSIPPSYSESGVAAEADDPGKAPSASSPISRTADSMLASAS